MQSNDPQLRELLLSFRQAALIFISAIERFLGMPQSITPKHKRD